jgi:hypothetical protein
MPNDYKVTTPSESQALGTDLKSAGLQMRSPAYTRRARAAARATGWSHLQRRRLPGELAAEWDVPVLFRDPPRKTSPEPDLRLPESNELDRSLLRALVRHALGGSSGSVRRLVEVEGVPQASEQRLDRLSPITVRDLSTYVHTRRCWSELCRSAVGTRGSNGVGKPRSGELGSCWPWVGFEKPPHDLVRRDREGRGPEQGLELPREFAAGPGVSATFDSVEVHVRTTRTFVTKERHI